MEKIFTDQMLTNMKKIFNQEKGEIISPSLPLSTEKKFFLFGGSVFEREDGYWFDYSSQAHGDLPIVKKILQEDYFNARAEILSFSDLYKKYPEVDGDIVKSKKIIEQWSKEDGEESGVRGNLK